MQGCLVQSALGDVNKHFQGKADKESCVIFFLNTDSDVHGDNSSIIGDMGFLESKRRFGLLPPILRSMGWFKARPPNPKGYR